VGVRGPGDQAGQAVEERHFVILRDAHDQETHVPTEDGYLFFYVTSVGVRAIICTRLETDPDNGVVRVWRGDLCVVTVPFHVENGGPISWELVHRSVVRFLPRSELGLDTHSGLVDEAPVQPKGYL